MRAGSQNILEILELDCSSSVDVPSFAGHNWNLEVSGLDSFNQTQVQQLELSLRCLGAFLRVKAMSAYTIKYVLADFGNVRIAENTI